MMGTLKEPIDLTQSGEDGVMKWLYGAKPKEWACYHRGRNIATAPAWRQDVAAALCDLASIGSLWPEYKPAPVLLFQRRFRGGFEYLMVKGSGK